MRVRVKHGAVELEVEGSEAEVSGALDRMKALLSDIGGPGPAAEEQPAEEQPSTPEGDKTTKKTRLPKDGIPLPDDFGEFMSLVPKGAQGTERQLAAAYWSQQKSKDGRYKPAEVGHLLEEHGHKLGNAAQTNTNNVNQKRAYKSGEGFKVSQPGIDALTKLFAGEGTDK